MSLPRHVSIGAALVVAVVAGGLGCNLWRVPILERSLGYLARRAVAGARQLEARTAPGARGGTGRTPREEPPEGYVPMTAKAQLDALHGNALLLIDQAEERVVPIFVGNTEALSIRLRLEGERYPRPLTHDLLDHVILRLDASFVRAQVDELRDNTYIGSVVVRDHDDRLIEIDARPSDAIALAIGQRAPIFMAQKVLDAAGHRIDELEQLEREGSGGGVPSEPLNATRL